MKSTLKKMILSIAFSIVMIECICYAKEISVSDVKKEKTMKFIYDANDSDKLDCINYDICIEEDDYNKAEYTRQNIDGDYSESFLYKLVFKKNNQILRNSLVFFNGYIYGTDDEGHIIKDDICNYNGKYYVSQGQRGIVLKENDRILNIGNKKYYVDENANVFTGQKLFLKETGIEYIFNDNYEIIERNEVFSIEEKNGDRYIKNYDKYKLDFYVIGGKGYLIEGNGKIKKFDYKQPTFVEYKSYDNGKEVSNLRRFDGDSFYVNNSLRIKLYLSNEKQGLVAFDNNGFLVRGRSYKTHRESVTESYKLYDQVGKEIEGDEGIREIDGKTYYKKQDYNSDALNSELHVDKNGNVYYADKNCELIKNKTIANIFTFDKDYKLVNNYNIKSTFSIAANYSFFNNYISYFRIVNGGK